MMSRMLMFLIPAAIVAIAAMALMPLCKRSVDKKALSAGSLRIYLFSSVQLFCLRLPCRQHDRIRR